MKELLPVRQLSGIRDLISDLGGNFARIAKEAELPTSALEDLDGYVSLRHAHALTNIAARVLKRRDFGLLWGARSDLLLLGPVSIAILNAPTVRGGLQIFSEHLPAASPVLHVGLIPLPGTDNELLGVTNLMKRPPSIAQAMERNMVIIFRILRSLIGADYVPEQVWMKHAQMASDAAYRRAFGIVPQFEQDAFGIVIRRRDLQRKVANRDAMLFEMADRYIRQQGATKAASRLVEAVRVLSQTGDHTLESLAKIVGVHSRTLQRRLRQAGVSVVQMRDEARRDRAEHLLAASDESITSIALSLGYADLASFSHSCRRWFSYSPTVMRRKLRERKTRAGVDRTHPLLVAHRLRRTPEGA